MIKAIIFDMDGLLIDSEPIWNEAKVAIFNKAGIPITEDVGKESQGLRLNETVNYWLLRFPGKSTWSPEKLEEKLIEKVIQLVKEKGKPLPGAKEIVELLAKNNLPIALASSSPIEIINPVLEKIPIRQYLKVIRSAQSEIYGKPHPAIYMNTAKELGVLPEFCLAFEDSINGVISAKAAKMKCLAVPNEFVKNDPRFCLADMKIDSLKDFRLEFLDKF
jgi:mannitol-1-/sugar-/sorbitol-6-/2-deoxyglucose-6-phosphatase